MDKSSMPEITDCFDKDLPKIPKRKVSVFYRSFDVIPSTKDGEKMEVQKCEEKGKEISQTASGSSKEDFVNNYRSLIESGGSSSSSSPERRENCLNAKKPMVQIVCLPPTMTKLPEVREDVIVNDYNTIRRRFEEINAVSERLRADKRTAVNVRENSSDCKFQPLASQIAERTRFSTWNSMRPSPETRLLPWNDPARIKVSEYPRPGRSVGPEMSSREDSSISDSDESVRNECEKRAEIPAAVAVDREVVQKVECEEKKVVEIRPGKQRNRSVRRSLSEGDSNHRECRCGRFGRDSVDEKEKYQPFPSFTDSRLRASGLLNVDDTDTLYRENLPEIELERKYTAFSIGLSTDRITLHRRMTLSRRQRDLSERSFTCEIQKMQRDIQELSPLCTDRDSIDRVEKVRRQLDMVARCAHRVSCAAETLGAVHQENRLSRAILIADRYLQVLRSRCENLTAEVAETKRILVKNNIVLEENSAELVDDLPRIRYRSGTPANNRTMMARRRASIATISRPLATSQDVLKDSPRQRNSVSGRVTLRRPSLCETQKWETEKLNRTDSSNSVGELRDIFEQAESRRDSIEENNNVLRIDQTVNVDVNAVRNVDVDDGNLSTEKQEQYEVETVNSSGKELKLRISAAESLWITRNYVTWQPMIWWILIFFLGFYVKHVISSLNSYDVLSLNWWTIRKLSSHV